MSCTSFTGTTSTRLFYCVDTDSDEDIPTSQNWTELPFTSESFSGSLETSSESLLGYDSDSTFYLFSVSTTGGISQDFSLHPSFLDLLHSVADFRTSDSHDGLLNLNEKTKELAFLKIVSHEEVTDYYLYRGCRVNSANISIAMGSFGSVDFEIAVKSLGNPTQTTPHYLGQNPSLLNTAIASWSFTPYSNFEPLTASALTSLILGTPGLVDHVFTDLSVSFSREVTRNSILGSKAWDNAFHLSKLSANIEGEIYLPTEDFLYYAHNDQQLYLSLQFSDTTNMDQIKNLTLLFNAIKVTEFSEPVAASPDSDMIVPVSFSVYKESNVDFVTVSL